MEEESSKVFFNTKDILLPTEEMEAKFIEFQGVFLLYRSAIKEVSTKLDILSDEFQAVRKRNPIEYMKSRVKSPKSIFEKMKRKNLSINLQSMKENLDDIAGMRVICSFIDDIYVIADMLIQQNDITLIERNDYIKNPKRSGYRSLHLVIEIPVFFSDHTELVKVEVQIRTIAMDFWASLEHKIYYKFEGNAPERIRKDLKECAEIISYLDQKMLSLNEEVQSYNLREQEEKYKSAMSKQYRSVIKEAYGMIIEEEKEKKVVEVRKLESEIL